MAFLLTHGCSSRVLLHFSVDRWQSNSVAPACFPSAQGPTVDCILIRRASGEGTLGTHSSTYDDFDNARHLMLSVMAVTLGPGIGLSRGIGQGLSNGMVTSREKCKGGRVMMVTREQQLMLLHSHRHKCLGVTLLYF